MVGKRISKYDHAKIEMKWQKKWAADPIGHASDTSDKTKLYVLDMFPYPSGTGLHMGHVENFTATDIYSRYQLMNGFNVMHPTGWDAFGLPAENFAIKTGVHPAKKTLESINNFKKQMHSLGFAYDWEREINTSSPDYYQWTQWFFLLMYKNGLAYKAKAKVNWCEHCKTVLANEQVIDGRCDRCKNPVFQKDLEQWFFKITDYAEDLINGLDQVDWPESTKIAQKNWIGKSEGAELKFKVEGSKVAGEITVFTTRPDTLFGASYVVLAPEHELVGNLQSEIGNWQEVEQYIKKAQLKTELERTEFAKEKSGVKLEGIAAINPVNGASLPIFIADYVLSTYGTGAIMAVPAHDERDYDFAKKYDLPIKEVISGGDIAAGAYIGDGALVNSGQFSGLPSLEAKRKITDFVGGKIVTKYRLRDWLVSRQRYWGAPIPIIYCDRCGQVPVPEQDLPVTLPTDVDFKPTGESPLVYSKSFHNVKCPSCGQEARRESDTMDTFVCSSWYYYRFVDPKNKNAFAAPEKLKTWLPVDMYMGGAEHTVLHLLYARFFTKVLNKFGYVNFSEPFTKLRHQGIVLGEDGGKMSKSVGNVVNPDEVVKVYGADTARLYIMFMGPLEDMKPWNSQNIIGTRRFIEKVWRLAQKVDGAATINSDLESLLHKTIKKAGDDIEVFGLNTAISAMMILANEMERLEQIPPAIFEPFLKILAPFAPHVTDELWADLGHNESIHLESWPTYDKAKLIQETVQLVVQVNGKVRQTLSIPAGLQQKEVEALALASPPIQKWLAGAAPKKVVFVPNRLVNLVL